MENLATFKVTPSAYEHAMTSHWERSGTYHGNVEATPYLEMGLGTRKSNGKLFTVRTSDESFKSFSSSVGNGYLAPIGTSSFMRIHNDVTINLNTLASTSLLSTTSSTGGGREEEDSPAIGELLPVGDAVLPMLLIACAYMVVRWFHSRKLNKTVNSQNV